MSNQSITLIFTTAIILVACSKEENLLISHGDIWDCHHEMIWDSLSGKEALFGKWEWEYIGCFWNPEDANKDEFDGMTIEFKEDSSLDIRENGEITQTSNWKIVDGDADLFAVDVDPRVDQLYGRILFCNNRVVFNDSYRDGCDNYFKRKE